MDDSNSANCENYKDVGAAGKQLTKVSLEQTQKQLDELIEVSRGNVKKIIERENNLTDLKTISESLEKGAAEFEISAAAIKGKEWRKNVKIKIIFAGLLLILLIIIISFLVQSFIVK